MYSNLDFYCWNGMERTDLCLKNRERIEMCPTGGEKKKQGSKGSAHTITTVLCCCIQDQIHRGLLLKAQSLQLTGEGCI